MHPYPSRREFLRLVSLGSVAALGAPFAWGQTPQDKGRRKLGVALLGLGQYSSGRLGPALRETKLCQLMGVVTGHPEKAKQWAHDYGLAEKNLYNYDNFDHIADNPDIDIVYVVTPPALHPEFVIRAAKAGKHVISEKPMATSVADCDAMIAACKKAGVKFSIGYRLHFDPYHQELIRLQREKDFGAFTKMTGENGFIFGNRAWRVEKKLAGGGPLMDMGIYVVHEACLASGMTPVAVTAYEEPRVRPELFNEVEETIHWTMEFPGGATCEATSSYARSMSHFRAEGPRGWFELSQNAFSYNSASCVTSRGPLAYPPINQQAAQMDDFADCILNGRKTRVPGELGRRDMAIITAIYEAARTGKRVTVA